MEHIHAIATYLIPSSASIILLSEMNWKNFLSETEWQEVFSTFELQDRRLFVNSNSIVLVRSHNYLEFVEVSSEIHTSPFFCMETATIRYPFVKRSSIKEEEKMIYSYSQLRELMENDPETFHQEYVPITVTGKSIIKVAVLHEIASSAPVMQTSVDAMESNMVTTSYSLSSVHYRLFDRLHFCNRRHRYD